MRKLKSSQGFLSHFCLLVGYFSCCLCNIYHMKACQSQFTLIVLTLQLGGCDQGLHICSPVQKAGSPLSSKGTGKSGSDHIYMNAKFNHSCTILASVPAGNRQEEFIPCLFPHHKEFILVLIASCQGASLPDSFRRGLKEVFTSLL